MRQIKFRAWDGMQMHDDWIVFTDEAGEVTCRQLAKRAVAVMQFTGLLDKNGKEIYEGDIVAEYEIQFGWDASKIVVEYGVQSVDAFEGVGFNLWSFYGEHEDIGKAIRLQSEIEVIGNIYEDSHLLEDKDPPRTNHPVGGTEAEKLR